MSVMNGILRVGVCLVLVSVAAWAQTGQLGGTIKDPSGSAIPGAAVKATQTATGVIRTATSGGDGGFVLPNLPIGPYQVEVTKEGFSRYLQTGIVLQVDGNPIVDVAMKVGAVSDQVQVEANAAEVETRSTAIGGVITNQQVAEMPLNGRDPHELIFLNGMANFPGIGSYTSVRNYPTVVVSVAGGNGDAVTYMLDGTIWQDPYNSLSLPLPFPDALQEFKVETSAVPAQYGYHASATVNAVTKSGTNQYHGDLFEFIRNGDLNARDFFATARDTLKRNQFGGVVGGPVLPRLRNKLFFFGGYQRTSLRSDGAQNTAFIPTPASLGGDFTALASPACNKGRQVALPSSLGFNNNVIAPSLLDPVSVNLAKLLPVTADPCGRTLYGLVSNQDENLVVTKIDWQISDRHSLFGRYMSGGLTQSSSFDGKNPLSISTGLVHDLDYGFTIGDTYLFSSTLINSLRLGGNRANVGTTEDKFKSYADLGANISPVGQTTLAVAATGAFTIGGGPASSKGSHGGPLWSVFDDVSLIKGSHQFGFGGSIYQQGLNYFSAGNAIGTITFTGQTTGLILGDYMMGLPSTLSQGTVYGFYNRQYYAALYAQDSWKVNSRLTLNYGVRWEPYLAQYNDRHEQEFFSQAGFTQNIHSTVFTNAPAGLFFPGDSQYTSGSYLNGPNWKKFFPRLGLAWDPEGNGRMTIRAAYGMYGDRASMLNGSQEYSSEPFGATIAVSGGTFSNPWKTYPGGNPIPTLTNLIGLGVYASNTPFLPYNTFVSSPQSNFKPTYMNQWNLSIQRQLGKDWLVTANYVGNNTIHLISNENINQAVFLGLGPCSIQTASGPVSYPVCSTTGNQNQRRILSLQNPAQGQYYSGVGVFDDGGTAEYNGLFVSAQKRLSHGVTASANYTWSHCISDVYSANTGATGVAPATNRRQYRGNCVGIDLRQQFVLNLVATTPKFSNRALRLLASDWQVAPIVVIKSAQLFSVYSGTDAALTTAANQTPNLLNPNPYPANKTVNDWISASAFGPATPGAYGNLGYNNMKGPGVFQLNMAVSRNFSLGEKRVFQLRAEAFNLPNHLNPFAPGAAAINTGLGGNATLNSSNFGQITSDISGNNGLLAGDYRVVQIALKFVF